MVGTSIVSGLGLRSTAFLGTTAVSLTVPTAPTSFTATAVSGGTSVNLSWAAPASNGGATITSYTLKRGATTIYTGSGTSYTNTGLTPVTAYSYTVLATNSIGDGPTASTSVTTSAGVPSAPVLSGYQTTQGDSEYPSYHYIYWTVPANNGSAITGYRVEYFNGTSWSLFYTLSSTTTSDTVGVDMGNAVDVRIVAVNAVGLGTPSNLYGVTF